MSFVRKILTNSGVHWVGAGAVVAVAAAIIWHGPQGGKLAPMPHPIPLPQVPSVSAELSPPRSMVTAEPMAPEAAAPVMPVTPQPAEAFNPTQAKLGSALALLVSSWAEGGVLPRQLANTVAELAAQSGVPTVAEAALALRSATPREGPATQSLLLVEASRVLALPVPEHLATSDAAAQARKSWVQQQLEQWVTVEVVPATQNRWAINLHNTQQLLARGLVADAAQLLNSTPLVEDTRLNGLRGAVAAYLNQRGKLVKLVTAYAGTVLAAPQ